MGLRDLGLQGVESKNREGTGPPGWYVVIYDEDSSFFFLLVRFLILTEVFPSSWAFLAQASIKARSPRVTGSFTVRVPKTIPGGMPCSQKIVYRK